MLAYGCFQGDGLHHVRMLAWECISRIRDGEKKLGIFLLLAETDFLAGCPNLPQLLLKAVKSRQLPLIKPFVDFGVSVNTEAHNALSRAILVMYFEVLELFGSAKYRTLDRQALALVLKLTSESDFLRLVKLLGRPRLHGLPVDECWYDLWRCATFGLLVS